MIKSGAIKKLTKEVGFQPSLKDGKIHGGELRWTTVKGQEEVREAVIMEQSESCLS